MTDEIKKADIIKWLVRTLASVVVALVIFAYGTLVGRIDKTEVTAENAQERVSAVEGDIKEIRKSVEWLEGFRNEYIQKNGKLNFEDFISELFVQDGR